MHFMLHCAQRLAKETFSHAEIAEIAAESESRTIPTLANFCGLLNAHCAKLCDINHLPLANA